MTKLKEWLLYENPGEFLGTGREWFHFAVIVTSLILVSEWLGQNFLFEPPAKWYQDFQLRRRPKKQERRTRIVRIDPDDYQRFFSGSSPLPGLAVIRAACAVAARGAAVVIVDLDTSHGVFPKNFHLPVSAAPIVWAVDTTWKGDGRQGLTQKSDPVLAGRLAVEPPYGIATMPSDFDGVVRYWRHLEKVDGHPRPTLPWAAVEEFCRIHQDQCPVRKPEEENDRLEAFQTEFIFQNIRLSDLVDSTTNGPTANEIPASCPALAPDPRLKDRIVILGGSYSREDLHETPWGSRQGSELVAMAIEGIFDPTPPQEVGEVAPIALEVIIALLIAAIHHWIRPIAATLITLGFLPLGALISAELMFLVGDYKVGIVPFMLGVLIHQLVGSARRAEVLYNDLKKSRAE